MKFVSFYCHLSLDQISKWNCLTKYEQYIDLNVAKSTWHGEFHIKSNLCHVKDEPHRSHRISVQKAMDIMKKKRSGELVHHRK